MHRKELIQMADFVEIEGFHGTSKANANAILSSGYLLSRGDDHWVGEGVYLFVDGIGIGQKDAKDWAIYKAWDNGLKRNTYPFYGVIKSTVVVEEDMLLDLTTKDGVDVFNYIVEKCHKKLADIGKSKKYIDGYVINFGRRELKLNIDVVKANEYIQLSLSDRLTGIKRRIPNCTICAVANTTTIRKNELILSGRI